MKIIVHFLVICVLITTTGCGGGGGGSSPPGPVTSTNSFPLRSGFDTLIEGETKGQALPFASPTPSTRAINRLTREIDNPSSRAIALIVMALCV
jgi:hypothetical protein